MLKIEELTQRVAEMIDSDAFGEAAARYEREAAERNEETLWQVRRDYAVRKAAEIILVVRRAS